MLLRSLLPFVAVLLLAVFVTACGSGESGSNDSNEARDAGSAATETTDMDADTDADASDAEPGSEAAVEAKAGISSFTSTPELVSCMTKAGFRQDQPTVAGGAISWTHPDGARVVMAASSETALTVAGEIGTADAPANVDGARVTAGPPALTGAAMSCLDA